MELWNLMAAAAAGGTLIAISAAAATVGGSLVGLIFKNAAAAWREERDAAVDKAGRLERKVDEQAAQIQALELKVAELEKRTNYETYAERSGREHHRILDGLNALRRGVDANTAVVELLIKQAFPTASLPAQT